MSRSEVLTESVKAIFAKKRKRLLEEDGGLGVFVGKGFTPPAISFEVRESNALETIRQGSLTQAQVLDRTGYVPTQDDKVFVGAFYRNRPGEQTRRGWEFSSASSFSDSYESDSEESEPSMY